MAEKGRFQEKESLLKAADRVISFYLIGAIICWICENEEKQTNISTFWTFLIPEEGARSRAAQCLAPSHPAELGLW